MANFTTTGSDTYPAGHIIQVVGSGGSGYADSTSTSYGASGLTQAITFTAGNRIFITCQISLGTWGGGTDVGGRVKLYDETNSAEVADAREPFIYGSISLTGDNATPGVEATIPLQGVYTPPSGTAITIQVYWKCPWGGTCRFNRDVSWMTIMEIEV